MSLIVSISAFAFSGLPLIGMDRRDYKKHLAFPTGKLLKPLREKYFFEVEKLNGEQYCGLRGVYRGYFCRVYFDWLSPLRVRWTSSEICVLVYYTPILGADKNLDKKKLNSLNKKHRSTGYFGSYIDDRVFETAHIRVHRALYWMTEWNDIKEHLDDAIDLLEKESLRPIPPKYADELLAEDRYLHGPTVASFVFNELDKWR